jgi:ABC-2 type transport system permease protein
MKAYWYIMRSRILMTMAYRFQVISTVLCQIVILFASVFFWKAAYGINAVQNDTTLDQMIHYTVLSNLLAVLYTTFVEQNINQNVRQGNVAVDFIKPVNIMGSYFAADIGMMIGSLLFRFIPMYLISGLVFGFTLPVSFPALLLFVVSTFLGFLILWCICGIFGLFSFWVIQLGPIGGAKDYIIRFLSGSFVPIWFFPEGIQQVFHFLPFVHIYQTPISIYIGKITVLEAVFPIGIQLFWAVVMVLCLTQFQKVAFRKVVVQGG